MNIQLVIEMTPDGKVGVIGPLQNKVLCYGLLEIAKEVIREAGAVAERRVEPVAVMPRIVR